MTKMATYLKEYLKIKTKIISFLKHRKISTKVTCFQVNETFIKFPYRHDGLVLPEPLSTALHNLTTLYIMLTLWPHHDTQEAT